MRMSDGGKKMLISFEGVRLKAYKCPAGVWTIGIGSTEPKVNPTDEITEKEAYARLDRDLVRYEKAVNELVKVELTQHQFDVLVDFAYNAGVGNLKTSTLLKKVNASDFDAVPTELMKWTKGGGKELPGLVRRRRAEAEWWRDLANKPVIEEEQRVDPDPVPVKTITESKQANGAIAIGALGSVGAVKEVVTQVQEANDLFATVMSMLKDTNFLIMVAVVGIGAAIWYWRKKHMDQYGV